MSDPILTLATLRECVKYRIKDIQNTRDDIAKLTFVVDGNLIFKVEYTGPKPKPFNNSTELFFREKNRKDVKIEEFAAAVYEQNQETWTAWHNTAHRLVNECTEFDRNIVGVMEKFAPTITSLYSEFERVL